MILALLFALVAPQEPTPLAPPRGALEPRAPVRFAVIGDYGTTSPESFAVAALVHALEPRFIVTVGDNNYPDGKASTIDENIGQHFHDFIHPYTGNFGAGADTNHFFPSLGNHDWGTTDAQPYLDYFELPGNERYYEVHRGAVDVFVLDSDEGEPDGVTSTSVQAQWLELALARSRAPFKFVVLHHAPFSSSENHGSQEDLQWPFREWGASAVLTGHDHLYERLSVRGLTYFVNGLGGRSRYDFAAPVRGSQIRFNALEGAQLVEVDARGELARLRFLTSSGVVVDDYALPRGGIDPGARTLVPRTAAWSYLDGGVAPDARWITAGYDDSSWASGPAELGYGEGDEATSVGWGTDPSNRHMTSWYRHVFELGDPHAYAELELGLLRDDGAIAYLNGVEIARSNMPEGPVDATTPARTSTSGSEETTFFPFAAPAELLVDVAPRLLAAGRNVLAVELHQRAQNSTDASFAAELRGVLAGDIVLARGAEWRYRDDGVTPPASWIQPGFDDGSWAAGPAPLGYGEPDLATTLAFGGDPGARHVSTWLRARFTLERPAGVRWLECRLRRDDGAILYLNGQEAARFNLPLTGVGGGTLAGFDVAGVDEGAFLGTSLDPRLLVEGVNTLAVELHQAAPASDDLVFDLELRAHR